MGKRGGAIDPKIEKSKKIRNLIRVAFDNR